MTPIDPAARARELFDVNKWGYKRIGLDLGISAAAVRDLLGKAASPPARTRARRRAKRDPAGESRGDFLRAELAEAYSDRIAHRKKGQGQAVETNRRAILSLREELDAYTRASTGTGPVDVDLIIQTVLDLDSAILDEVIRRRSD